MMDRSRARNVHVDVDDDDEEESDLDIFWSVVVCDEQSGEYVPRILAEKPGGWEAGKLFSFCG